MGFFDKFFGTKTARTKLTPADKPQVDKEMKTAYVRPTQEQLQNMNYSERVAARDEFAKHRPLEYQARVSKNAFMKASGLRTALVEAGKAAKAVGRATGLSSLARAASKVTGRGGGGRESF